MEFWKAFWIVYPKLFKKLFDSSPFCMDVYVSKLIPKFSSVLDVGCGEGLLVKWLKTRQPSLIVGVDVWLRYLVRVKRARRYAAVIQADGRFLPFRRGVFDVAQCIGTIEHLPKNEGNRLLIELSRVATRNVVESPVGWSPQDEYDFNPYQEHRSAWYLEDFRHRGFKHVRSTGLRLKALSNSRRFALRLVPVFFGMVLFLVPSLFPKAGAEALYVRDTFLHE